MKNQHLHHKNITKPDYATQNESPAAKKASMYYLFIRMKEKTTSNKAYRFGHAWWQKKVNLLQREADNLKWTTLCMASIGIVAATKGDKRITSGPSSGKQKLGTDKKKRGNTNSRPLCIESIHVTWVTTQSTSKYNWPPGHAQQLRGSIFFFSRLKPSFIPNRTIHSCNGTNEASQGAENKPWNHKQRMRAKKKKKKSSPLFQGVFFFF